MTDLTDSAIKDSVRRAVRSTVSPVAAAAAAYVSSKKQQQQAAENRSHLQINSYSAAYSLHHNASQLLAVMSVGGACQDTILMPSLCATAAAAVAELSAVGRKEDPGDDKGGGDRAMTGGQGAKKSDAGATANGEAGVGQKQKVESTAAAPSDNNDNNVGLTFLNAGLLLPGADKSFGLLSGAIPIPAVMMLNAGPAPAATPAAAAAAVPGDASGGPTGATGEEAPAGSGAGGDGGCGALKRNPHPLIFLHKAMAALAEAIESATLSASNSFDVARPSPAS
jgi:hypothetical protein